MIIHGYFVEYPEKVAEVLEYLVDVFTVYEENIGREYRYKERQDLSAGELYQLYKKGDREAAYNLGSKGYCLPLMYREGDPPSIINMDVLNLLARESGVEFQEGETLLDYPYLLNDYWRHIYFKGNSRAKNARSLLKRIRDAKL